MISTLTTKQVNLATGIIMIIIHSDPETRTPIGNKMQIRSENTDGSDETAWGWEGGGGEQLVTLSKYPDFDPLSQTGQTKKPNWAVQNNKQTSISVHKLEKQSTHKEVIHHQLSKQVSTQILTSRQVHRITEKHISNKTKTATKINRQAMK